MTNIIVPERFETRQVRHGRALAERMMWEVGNLVERGKTPTRIVLSRGAYDDWRALLAHICPADWDGILPSDYAGCPIVFEPGTAVMRIEYQSDPLPVVDE